MQPCLHIIKTIKSESMDTLFEWLDLHYSNKNKIQIYKSIKSNIHVNNKLFEAFGYILCLRDSPFA